jgi:hypothetical protein
MSAKTEENEKILYSKNLKSDVHIDNSKKSDLVTWLYNEYKKTLELEGIESDHRYKVFINSLNPKYRNLFGFSRLQAYQNVRYGFPMRDAGYISATFLITMPRNRDVTEVNMGFVLWQRDIEGYAIKTETRETVGHGENEIELVNLYSEPEYICFSPTYESKDGEYRHNLIWYKHFQDKYAELIDIIGELEMLVLENIKNGNINIKVRFYPSEVQDDEDGPMQYVDSHRLGIKSVVAYFLSGYLRGYQFHQIHTLESHVKLFRELYLLFKPYCKKQLFDWENRRKLYAFVHGKREALATQYGIKFIPLTIHETLRIGDITYAPWREVYITARATNVLINVSAPGVATFGDWGLINGIDSGFLSTQSMKVKYAKSDKSVIMKTSINQVRDEVGQINGDNTEFVKLDKNMYDSLDYIQESIELSDILLAYTMEHVGFTLGSQYNQILNNSFIEDKRLALMFSEQDFQVKLLFEACYSLNALHTKTGIIHGDLHINNMTIYERKRNRDVNDLRGYQISASTPFSETAVVAYILSKKGDLDTYIFPYDGINPVIIDYSRAILDESIRDELISEFNGAMIETFYKDQAVRVLFLFTKYLPTFTKKYYNEIKGLISTNFSDIFKILSAVDLMAAGKNMALFWQGCINHKPHPMNKRHVPVATEGSKLGMMMESMASDYMILSLTELIHTSGKSVKPIEFPAVHLFRKVFKQYNFSTWASGTNPSTGFDFDPERVPLRELGPVTNESTKYRYFTNYADGRLVDIYSVAHDNKYSSTDYEKSAPYVNIEQLSAHAGGLPDGVFSNDRGFEDYIASKKANAYMDVILEDIKRKTILEPAAASSSWVP